MVNIYAGNLSHEITEIDLRNIFEAHGKVDRASVVMDRMTNQSKGGNRREKQPHLGVRNSHTQGII